MSQSEAGKRARASRRDDLDEDIDADCDKRYVKASQSWLRQLSGQEVQDFWCVQEVEGAGI